MQTPVAVWSLPVTSLFISNRNLNVKGKGLVFFVFSGWPDFSASVGTQIVPMCPSWNHTTNVIYVCFRQLTVVIILTWLRDHLSQRSIKYCLIKSLMLVMLHECNPNAFRAWSKKILRLEWSWATFQDPSSR